MKLKIMKPNYFKDLKVSMCNYSQKNKSITVAVKSGR